jgi:hypothetical protein
MTGFQAFVKLLKTAATNPILRGIATDVGIQALNALKEKIKELLNRIGKPNHKDLKSRVSELEQIQAKHIDLLSKVEEQIAAQSNALAILNARIIILGIACGILLLLSIYLLVR